jgi:dimethylargininase
MRAVVRDVAGSFADALSAVPAPIDVALARKQHIAYREALEQCGAQLLRVPNDQHPDGCFVEDTAVVVPGLAVITRPGAPSRQLETPEIAETLQAQMDTARMTAPATLDGGDCMRVGKTIFVGRSARTNEEGIAFLADAFERRGYRVVPIDMPPGVLHLKCVCAPLGEDRITLADQSIPPEAFGAVAVVRIPAEESYAANVLAIANRVLVASGYPRTRDALQAAGFAPIEVDTSEFRKADGALTCLSILLPGS